MPKLTIDIDEDVFLPKYRHLSTSDNDIEFLWGGRDSGKSQATIQQFLLECISLPYFRCILVRKVFEDIKDSQWQGLKDQAEKWGIDHLFKFNSSPLEIRCLINNNKFIARGCDKPSKLKSITNPSHVWYEEGNQLTEKDYITISTTIRSDQGRVKERFTFNPECEIDYTEFWLYKTFFKKHFEKGEYSFKTNHIIELPKGGNVVLKIESVHSTYHDNEYCTPERVARHEQLKITNPYYHQIFTLGLWGNRQTGGQFYKCYSATKHIGIAKYNKALPIHLTFDFNVNPYMTALAWQIDGKVMSQIDEFLLPHPRNTSLAICSEFERKFPGHEAGLFIYGDPQGLKQTTAAQTVVRIKEEDYSEFTLITKALKKYNPSLRVNTSYPAVKLRGDFINTIFQNNFQGITIIFGENCKRTHAEYANLKEASDGTKHKEEYKDEETGVRCQKWGHVSDANDYLICRAFQKEFGIYKSNGAEFSNVVLGKVSLPADDWIAPQNNSSW